MTHGALVVIGSGPGIGVTTATHFASKGFKHIVLLSRNTERLSEDAAAVTKVASDTKVETITIDLADTESRVKETLAKVDAKLKEWNTELEVVLFNAARVGMSKPLEWTADELANDLKLGVVSMYIALQWAVPHLLKEASSNKGSKPAFLSTSGGLYKDPFPNFFSLSAVKAAQFNIMHSMSKAYAKKGVHFASVPISALVSPDAKVGTPQHIAETHWSLYEQGADGDLSKEVEDPDYYPTLQQIGGTAT